jgi:hypothetical protein
MKGQRLLVSRVKADPQAKSGGHVYELTPVSYLGPWKLKAGTEIEILKEPK